MPLAFSLCDEILLLVQKQVGEAVFEGRTYIEIDENLLLAVETRRIDPSHEFTDFEDGICLLGTYFDVALKTRSGSASETDDTSFGSE